MPMDKPVPDRSSRECVSHNNWTGNYAIITMCSSQSNSTKQEKNQQNMIVIRMFGQEKHSIDAGCHMIHDQENVQQTDKTKMLNVCHRDELRLNRAYSSASIVHREPGSSDERNGAQENNQMYHLQII